ncbi:MAG: hypothetical protein KGL39_53660 [Patescibacteria group bacterium]|nr:hypothetical protein [Patescibacteria group bacterium]
MAKRKQQPGAMGGAHNRKPQQTTMAMLGNRRNRRKRRASLRGFLAAVGQAIVR